MELVATLQLCIAYALCLLYSSVVALYIALVSIYKGWDYFKVKEQALPQSDSFLQTMEKFRDHHIREITSRGIKLHYVSMGDKSKPLVIFIHGFPDFWYLWRHQMTHFAKNYWVVAVDLRGFGESDKPKSKEAYRGVEIVEDIRELIATLGRAKATVVGHDWGGYVCWTLASKYPEVVDRAVIINCPHPKAFKKIITTPSQLLASWYMFFFQMPFLPEIVLSQSNLNLLVSHFKKSKELGYTTDEDIAFYKYVYSKPGALTPPINYYRANVVSGISRLPQALNQSVRVPVLLLWGEKDVFLRTEGALESVRYVDTLRVRFFPNASHWPHLEEPEAINQQIEAFFKERFTDDS